MILPRSRLPPTSGEDAAHDEQCISFRTVLMPKKVQLESLSAAVLLNVSCAISLTVLETSARRCTVERTISILHHQESDTKLIAELIRFLELGGIITEVIAGTNLNST